MKIFINTLICFSLISILFLFTKCSESISDAPTIRTSVNILGESDRQQNAIMVPMGTDVVYKFELSSSSDIKTIELWSRKGIGVNAEAPKKEKSWSYLSSEIGKKFVVTDTIQSLSEDEQYSVYVQDSDDNFTTDLVSCFLDVMLYEQTLTDGASSGNTKTFMNFESGRSLFIANTISDPTGVDMGFAYMENSDYQACLVSFDEYYKTGNYAMVKNNLNAAVTFKDATGVVSSEELDVIAKSVTMLKNIYDSAADYPTILDFSKGKIASAIQEGDMVSFQTQDNRYGLMHVKGIDRKGESISNNQTITLEVIIMKKVLK